MKERIVVAMSGGVDSSAAAALLQKQGFEVIGITMCFPAYGQNLAGSNARKPSCCGLEAIDDARRVAYKLNIKHYTINLQKALRDFVIEDFLQEYLNGRTPNPCVRCNQFIKFDILLKKAMMLGAKFLATGHYARIVKKNEGYQLKKAKDLKKDQSYFLYRLSQWQLKNIIFPLGNYTKLEVRRLAKNFDLPVADKISSQEICFLPEADYRAFFKGEVRQNIRPGLIIDQQGNILGRHQGIAFYTIGQRQGLGIAKGSPLYVTKIDARNNQITVGTKKDALRSEFFIKQPHFILGPIKKKVALKVRIRYNHKETLAKVIPIQDKFKVKFATAQFAITPGQSAVFYDKDTVLGGGIIEP